MRKVLSLIAAFGRRTTGKKRTGTRRSACRDSETQMLVPEAELGSKAGPDSVSVLFSKGQREANLEDCFAHITKACLGCECSVNRHTLLPPWGLCVEQILSLRLQH